MKQQDTLRQAMQHGSPTRAQHAQSSGKAPRTRDKRLLPETTIRLLPSPYGLRKCSDLSRPCDRPNPAMPDDALIFGAALTTDDSPKIPVLIERKHLGPLPVNIDDEGLAPVDVAITHLDVHRRFEGQAQAKDIALARAILAQADRAAPEA